MTSKENHEEAIQDLAKDMVDASIKGLINLQDQPGDSRGTAEHILFSETLANSMIFLSRCGIKPYTDEKGPY